MVSQGCCLQVCPHPNLLHQILELSDSSKHMFLEQPRKTLKMIEQPSLDELNTQLGLLRSWLPHMARLTWLLTLGSDGACSFSNWGRSPGGCCDLETRRDIELNTLIEKSL